MKTSSHYVSAVFFAFAVLFLLASCSLFSRLEGEGPSSAAGSAAGRATVSVLPALSPAARTLLPAEITLEDFSALTFSYEASSDSSDAGSCPADNLYDLNSSLSSVYFSSAEYAFTLTASLNGASYTGSLTKTLAAGANALSFELAAAEGYGGFSLTLAFTGSAAAVTGSVLATDGTEKIADTALALAPSSGGGSVTYAMTPTEAESAGLAAGTYRLCLSFYGDEAKRLLLNSYKELVRLEPGRTATESRSIDLNEVYSISYYDVADGDPVLIDGSGDVTFVSASVPVSFSRKSAALTLPKVRKRGYGFAGWYRTADLSGDVLTEIPAGSAGDVALYAKWGEVQSLSLYVSATGSDSTGDGSESSPYLTLSRAVTHIKASDDYAAWTVYINGTLAASSLDSSLDEYAYSLTLWGLNYTSGDGAKDGFYNGDTSSSTLSLTTSLPVTLYGLFVSGGSCGIYISGNGDVSFEKSGVQGAKNGIYISGNGNVTVDGSSIVSNQGAEYGAGIYKAGSGSLTVTDSSITNNTASQSGGGIYLASGSATIGESGYVGKAGSQNYAAKGGGIYVAGGSLTLSGGHVEGNSASAAGGGVYNDGCSLLLEGESSVASNTVTSGSGGGIYNKGGTLSLGGSSTVSSNTATGGQGGGIYNDGGSVFMYGSAVIGDKSASSAASSSACSNYAAFGGGIYNTGNVYIGYSDADTVDTSFAGGIFYNYSYYQGGAIYSAGSSSVIKMSGGSLAYNGARSDGGAVRLGGSSESFVMTGGTVDHNVSNTGSTENTGNGGGGFYLGAGNTLTLSGDAVVSYNSAWSGGGVYLNDANLVMSGAAAVSANSSTLESGYGGGVYLNVDDGYSGSFIMGGTSVVYQNSAYNGGGLAVTGGQVSIGYTAAGTVDTSFDGGIVENTASASGGGVYAFLHSPALSMAGGYISSNTATGYGGGLMLGGASTFTLSGGSIAGNSASNQGGGVYIDSSSSDSGALLTMTGGSISGNSSDDDGSGVYVGNELRLGGSAAIASGNEVYLPGYHYIYLTDTLTGTAPVATVTPENFISGLQVLRNAEDAVSDYVSLYNGYFALKDGGDAWYIDSAGCLQNAGGISLSVPAYSSDDLELTVAESGGSYVFSAKSGYSSYVWTINDSIQTTTENSVTLASSTLAVGSNALLLVATDSSEEVHEATATVTRTE